MKKNTVNRIAVLISILPLLYLAFTWNSLPEIVPVHFNSEMKPDRMGNKAELWIPTSIMAIISVGLYFLLNNLHRIDPKRVGESNPAAFNKIAFGLVVFLAVLNVIMILSAQGSTLFQSLLFPLIGLLFAFLGNYMNNIKPNYFAGIRLPWTLSDDENWRKTHHLAGKLWFAGGMMIAVAGLLLPVHILIPVFIAIVCILVFIPVIYSYRLFKRKTTM